MSQLIDFDSWPTEVEACERLNHTLLANLVQRDKRQRLSPEYNRLSASIQIGLNQFETELEQLRIKLDGAAKGRTITFEEIERRQRQVELLQSQLQQLQRKYTNATRQDRAALLEQPGSSQSPWQNMTTTAGQQNDEHNETKAFGVKDVESLKRQQIDILEEQNRGLETLSQTITRQRALATQLGLEVEDQNEILDNLATSMDRVDTRVNVETGNIGQINRQDSTCGYWIVILSLLVGIVIVALL